MIIFPAIDLYESKAVRLLKGEYQAMTVYSDNPLSVAKAFEDEGATHIHLVDLEGAKNGGTPNLSVVEKIVSKTRLFAEIGGGIRDMEKVKRYLDSGISRVILGTAAVQDPEFLREAVEKYGEKIAVGADVKEGKIAIKGWLEKSELSLEEFLLRMQTVGVQYAICTDVSKDGAMKGTNRALYQELSKKFSLHITASGGVSTLDDVAALREMDLYGAIIGKAYYTGAIKLREAIEVAK